MKFDKANKLSKSLGLELDELANQFCPIRYIGDLVILLDFLSRLRDEALSRPIYRAIEEGKVHDLPLIDVLHLALFFWRRGVRKELGRLLTLGGFQKEDHLFWRVAQAIFEAERKSGGPGEEATALGQMLPAQASLLREVITVGDAAQ